MSQERIVKTNAVEFIDKHYGEYSLYLLSDRALCSIRDGLKPVQRRILYQAYRDRAFMDKPHMKSAKLASSTVGNYHPHNPDSVYGAAVNMTVPWIQVQLIDGKGSFGIVQGDDPASSRYTEMRLSPVGELFVKPLASHTVPMVPNFSDQDVEPVYLPAPFPNLLVNGAEGIAVGYSTKIPQHNPLEVFAAIRVLLTTKNPTVDDILAVMPAPDWATGGTIIDSESTIRDYYESGRGRIMLRGKLVTDGKELMITELPYGVSSEKLRTEIAAKITDGKITSIADVSDLSDMKHGLRIAIKPRRGVTKEMVEAQLVANTSFQSAFNANLIAVDDAGIPHLYSVQQILEEFVAMRHEVIERQATYDKEQNLHRAHIIEGLLKVLVDLDTTIHIIRESKNADAAKAALKKEFQIDDVQAEFVLSLQLRKLTHQDSLELEREQKRLASDLKKLELLLSSESARNKRILSDLDDVAKVIGEHPRRTRLGGSQISDKAMKKATAMKRKGGTGQWFIDETGVATQLPVGTPLDNGVGFAVWHDGTLKVFSGKGLPNDGADTPMAPSLNGLLSAGVAPTGFDLLFVTKLGKALRVNVSTINPQGVAGNGVAGIKLADGDELLGVYPVNDESVVATVSGKAWKLTDVSDIPVKGRNGGGVGIHAFTKGDEGIVATIAGLSPKVDGKPAHGSPRAARPTRTAAPHIEVKTPAGLVFKI